MSGKFVDMKSLVETMKGSFEQTWSEVQAALPDSVTPIATFPDRVVYEKDGQFYSSGWSKHDSKVEFDDPVSAGVSTFGDERVGVVTGRSVLEAVDDIMAGRPSDLVALTRFVKPGEKYFATDFIEGAEEALGDREWVNFYEENRKEVRKTCHGRLGILESQVPSRRFSKLRGDLEAYRPQIEEAVGAICSLASDTAETIKSMGDLEFKEDLVSDALEIMVALRGLGESASPVHMRDFVSLIDRSCDRLRDLLVMAEYVSIDREKLDVQHEEPDSEHQS